MFDAITEEVEAQTQQRNHEVIAAVLVDDDRVYRFHEWWEQNFDFTEPRSPDVCPP